MRRNHSYDLPALIALAISCVFLPGCKHGAAPAPKAQSSSTTAVLSMPLNIERLDPAIDRIIPADAKLERVVTGFQWVEGPVWDNGGLYFAAIHANSIERWTPEQGVSLFLHPSGYQGKTRYPGPEPGSNGMTLDARGRLTVAGHARRDVFRLESLSPNAQITVLADSYHGKKLNSPNDLVYGSDGSLYFTDPPYGLPTQGDKDPLKQLRVNGVYRIPHALEQKPGAPPNRAALQLLVSNLSRPNGIAFSPDEKYLYVDNSQPQKLWMRYRVRPDGTLTDPKVFYDATSVKGRGVPDGMKVDMEGNIYSAGPGGIWIFSPAGKVLARISTPETVGNLAWGGPNHKTLYIATSTSIYRIHLNVVGEPVVRSK